MSSPIYQEAEGGTFESQGKHYDLNQIFRDTAHLPVRKIKVNRLKWIVGHDPQFDQARVERADLEAPCLVYFDPKLQREVVVDGYHRLCKALKEGRAELNYRRVSKEVLQRAELKPGEKHARPPNQNW